MERVPCWPYLTSDIPAVYAEVRSQPDDFFVEEIPQYLPSGEGTHVYFCIEKKNLTTLDLIRKLARKLGRPEKDFGYAGLKDANATTRQIISLEHIDPKEIENIDIEGVKVLWINRHKNKLKLGHLAANKFAIKLRNVKEESRVHIDKSLSILKERGVPNYFGYQRFGVRQNNWILGKAILKEDWKTFCDFFLGRPDSKLDKAPIKKARELYDKGKFELAYHIWPRYFSDARRALRILSKDPQNYKKAVFSVDRKLRKLFISAYQSYLFNDVLAERINTIDRLFKGDLAYKHDTSGIFKVEDPQAELERLRSFKVSPTGPLYGYRIRLPDGPQREIEEKILQREDLSLDDFRKIKGHKVKGGRRPLRVPISDLVVSEGKDNLGSYIELSFTLPSGSYATAVLREILKDNLLTETFKEQS